MYYSGQEIVEIAVRIEENGNEFYTAAAEMIPGSNDIKGLFYDLAEKEILHISIFQKLAEKFDAESFDFSTEDASDYINRIPAKNWQRRLKPPKKVLRLPISLRMTVWLSIRSC
jgi:rubrerythrin